MADNDNIPMATAVQQGDRRPSEVVRRRKSVAARIEKNPCIFGGGSRFLSISLMILSMITLSWAFWIRAWGDAWIWATWTGSFEALLIAYTIETFLMALCCVSLLVIYIIGMKSLPGGPSKRSACGPYYPTKKHGDEMRVDILPAFPCQWRKK